MRSPCSSAAATRATALSISASTDGIGQQLFQRGIEIIGGLGQRHAAQPPAAAPAPAKICAQQFARQRSRRPASAASAGRKRSARRRTPRRASARASVNRFAAVARPDPAHRAGGRAHHHAFGGDDNRRGDARRAAWSRRSRRWRKTPHRPPPDRAGHICG